MPGAPLSLPEREEISVALIEDPAAPWPVIAREVAAGGGRDAYRPAVAERRAAACRRRPRARRLEAPGGLRDRSLTAAIWYNETTSQVGPGRSLLAYDHRPTDPLRPII